MNRFGCNGMTGRDQVDLMGDHDLVCDVDRCVARERALMTDEDRPTYRDVQPEISVEGRYQVERVADRLADQLLEGFSNRILVIRVPISSFKFRNKTSSTPVISCSTAGIPCALTRPPRSPAGETR